MPLYGRDDGVRTAGPDAAADAEGRRALRLAGDLRQAVRRERETAQRLSEYLAAKAATAPGGDPHRRSAQT